MKGGLQPLMRIAILAVVLAALVVGAPVGARAQGGGDVPPTQVVFALDDSGSMFGANGSDPNMQRYNGVIRLVEVLDRFLDEDDPHRVEIGAISFGSEAHELSPLASVRGAALAAVLRAERDSAATRHATDFREALCLAWETVTGEAAPRDSGCPDATGTRDPRSDSARRFVVLVTDGAPAPGEDVLEFADQPDPAACPVRADPEAFGESREKGAANAYLCALGTVWANLNQHTRVTLIVIGLDQQDQWFDDASPYWRRAGGCGLDPASPCDRVIRSVDADSLAEQILGAYPTIDLCERVDEREPFDCDIPGGLTRVQFLITGVPEGSVTVVDNGRDVLRSDDAPGHDEFRPREGGAHIWSFADRPYRGSYRLTLEAPISAPDALVFVDYKAAEFSVGEQVWDEETGELSVPLTVVAGGEVFPRSVETQPYEVEIQSAGRIVQQQVTLEHVADGREFTVAIRAAPGDSEFALYLELGPARGRIEVARDAIPASVFVTATPTPAATATPSPPTPTPSPTATPAPPAVVEEEPEEGGSNLLLWIILAVILLLAVPVVISAYSVRQPQPYDRRRRDEEAPPIELAVIETIGAKQDAHDLVRFGIFAWRGAPPHRDDDGAAPRTVMLRWIIFGPLVVRRVSRLGEDWRGHLIATPPERDVDDDGEAILDLAEDIELHRRQRADERDF